MESIQGYLPVYISMYLIVLYLFKFVRVLSKVTAIFLVIHLSIFYIYEYILSYLNNEMLEDVVRNRSFKLFYFIGLYYASARIYSSFKT